LGTYKIPYEPHPTDPNKQVQKEDFHKLILGRRYYELSNHLGNVLAVISDKKILNGTTFEADIVSANDYYPFGMTIESRSFSSEEYRFGFNGKENDKDFGEGHVDFGARIYDSRTTRWLSQDPLAYEMPAWSPYNFGYDNPIKFLDPDGRKPMGDYYDRKGNKTGTDGKNDGKAYIENQDGDISFDGKKYYEMAGGAATINGDYGEGFNQVDDDFEKQIPVYMEKTKKRYKEFQAKHQKQVYNRQTGHYHTVGTYVPLASLGIAVSPTPLMFIRAETGHGYLDFKYEMAGKGKAYGQKEEEIGEFDPPITKTMYLIGNKYYNVNGAGNFLWGYAGKTLGIISEHIMVEGADFYVKTKQFNDVLGYFNTPGDKPYEQQMIRDGFNCGNPTAQESQSPAAAEGYMKSFKSHRFSNKHLENEE